DRLPGVHCGDVRVGDEPLRHEQGAPPVDRFELVRGRGPHLDGLGREDLGGHAPAASSEIGSPAWRRRTRRSLAGLFRKFLNARTTAPGAAVRARAARPSWASTTSALLGIWLTGEWITWTARPASLTRFFSWFAPIRLEPIPASQAKTTSFTSSACRTVMVLTPIRVVGQMFGRPTAGA